MLLLDFGTFRSHRLRRLVEGAPLVLIESGKSTVKLAVLEVSGKVSFIKSEA